LLDKYTGIYKVELHVNHIEPCFI